MPPFEIPESVKAYFLEGETRAVVDTLVSTLDDPVLPDMDRGRLVSLSEGVLLACQIRADFVGFMADLWENTFGAAIEDSGLNEFFSDDCTIKEVWTEKYFWSYVTRGEDLERPHFELTVQVQHRSNEVMLCVWRFGGDDEFMDFGPRLQLPDGWRRMREDDGSQRIETTAHVSIAGLVGNSDEGIAELRNAASGVIRLICKLLP